MKRVSFLLPLLLMGCGDLGSTQLGTLEPLEDPNEHDPFNELDPEGNAPGNFDFSDLGEHPDPPDVAVDTLRIGLVIHVEGPQWLEPKDGRTPEEEFENFATKLRDHSANFENFASTRGVAPFIQWEINHIIEPIWDWDRTLLTDLANSGVVSLHADNTDNTDAMSAYLTNRRAALSGIAPSETLHDVSGICSTGDWGVAAIRAGFRSVTGIVDFCEKALPLPLQTAAMRGCFRPGDCHDPWGEPADRVNPWRIDTARSFTTHAPGGELVLVPGSGEISCLADAAHTRSPLDCVLRVTGPFGDNDLVYAAHAIDLALANSEPNKVNQVHFTWSFGKYNHPDKISDFLEGIHNAYVATGLARWSTIDATVDAYLARSTPYQYP